MKKNNSILNFFIFFNLFSYQEIKTFFKNKKIQELFNIKLSLTKEEDPLFPLHKIILICTSALHLSFALTQKKVPLKIKIKKHMFLWATSHLIGFLQTFFHEFSHLIAILATKKTPAKVSIYLNNYVTFLSGIYGGSFIYEDSIGLEPKKSNNISAIYLKNKIQTKNIIINSAGPLGGTLIGYFLFKFFKSKNQEIFKNKLFNNICLIGIFGQLH